MQVKNNPLKTFFVTNSCFIYLKLLLHRSWGIDVNRITKTILILVSKELEWQEIGPFDQPLNILSGPNAF